MKSKRGQLLIVGILGFIAVIGMIIASFVFRDEVKPIITFIGTYWWVLLILVLVLAFRRFISAILAKLFKVKL